MTWMLSCKAILLSIKSMTKLDTHYNHFLFIQFVQQHTKQPDLRAPMMSTISVLKFQILKLKTKSLDNKIGPYQTIPEESEKQSDQGLSCLHLNKKLIKRMTRTGTSWEFKILEHFSYYFL